MSENQNPSQSRAVTIATKALSDLVSSQRSQLTGQSRVIAALCFAHAEEFFEDHIAPEGATVDLAKGHVQIDSKRERRSVVIERINLILERLFGVLEYDPSKSGAARWAPVGNWTAANIVAFRQALRRTMPTVAHLIAGTPKGAPVIQEEYKDAEMLDTRCAVAIVGAGAMAGRLKVRADLVATADELAKAKAAGQDLSRHPPVLLDGTQGRTIEALARVARESFGLAVPTTPAERSIGAVTSALHTVRKRFADVMLHPDTLRELYPQGVITDAKVVCLTLLSALYVEPGGELSEATLETDFARFREERKAA